MVCGVSAVSIRSADPHTTNTRPGSGGKEADAALGAMAVHGDGAARRTRVRPTDGDVLACQCPGATQQEMGWCYCYGSPTVLLERPELAWYGRGKGGRGTGNGHGHVSVAGLPSATDRERPPGATVRARDAGATAAAHLPEPETRVVGGRCRCVLTSPAAAGWGPLLGPGTAAPLYPCAAQRFVVLFGQCSTAAPVSFVSLLAARA